MSDLDIHCNRCGGTLDHACDENLPRAIKKLYEHVLEGNPLPFRDVYHPKRGYRPDDPDEKKLPFFCESYLYPLLGKDDARTVLALIHSVIRAAGLDPDVCVREYNSVIRQKERAAHDWTSAVRESIKGALELGKYSSDEALKKIAEDEKLSQTLLGRIMASIERTVDSELDWTVR